MYAVLSFFGMKRDRISAPALAPALVLALVVLGMASAPSVSAGETAWYPGANLSSTPWRSAEATIACDPATGSLHVAWTDRSESQPGQVMGRRWEPSAETWQPPLESQPQNLSLSEWTDGGPALFFDHAGQGHLLWTRRYGTHQGAPEDGTDLMWRSWDGSAWTPERLLLHADSFFPGTYGLIPVVTPDSTLLFITFGNGYRLTEYRQGDWSEITPWYYLDFYEGVQPVLSHMVMDADGLIHAGAFAKNSSQIGYDRWFRDAYYLTFDGTVWTAPVNLSATFGVAHDLNLAFDRQGRLRFLWSDPNSPYSSESRKSAIWERVYDGETWTPNAEITAYNLDQTIGTFSLAADVTGTLHLAWSEGIMVQGAETDSGIYYTSGNGISWGQESAVFTTTGRSRYPLLNPCEERAYIVWHEDPSSSRDVYFARPFEGHDGPWIFWLPWVFGRLP